MKTTIFIIVVLLCFCTSAFASHWIQFFKEEELKWYFDEHSLRCYQTFDKSYPKNKKSAVQVWVKTNNISTAGPYLWSIDCFGRKIDKEGGDFPDTTGEHIQPDSMEEKIYTRMCFGYCH